MYCPAGWAPKKGFLHLLRASEARFLKQFPHMAHMFCLCSLSESRDRTAVKSTKSREVAHTMSERGSFCCLSLLSLHVSPTVSHDPPPVSPSCYQALSLPGRRSLSPSVSQFIGPVAYLGPEKIRSLLLWPGWRVWYRTGCPLEAGEAFLLALSPSHPWQAPSCVTI